MRSKRTFTLLLFLAIAALPAFSKPNFSGDWKLSPGKSTFGEMPAPDSMTQKITHAEPNLSVASKQSSAMGDFDMQAKYTTDGKECTNEGFGGAPSKSIVKWDGDTLVLETKGQFGDTEFTMSEKWVLSADGKTLTITRLFKSAMGEGQQKMVLDKQ